MLIHCILPAISRLCAAAPNLWVYAMPLHAELSQLLPEDKYMYFAGPYLGELLAAVYCIVTVLLLFSCCYGCALT